jgi:hypothetical protein
MSPNELILYATLATAIVAVCSVVFTVISHRREINASIYLDLSDRLHRFLQTLPAEVRVARLVGEDLSDSPAAMTAMADFLHIINAAHTLYAAGYFSGKLWLQLRIQAERGLRLPICRTHWPRMRSDFSRSPGFVAFVEECQTGG